MPRFMRGIHLINMNARTLSAHAKLARLSWLKILVYAEWHDEVGAAIHREKRMKHWPREWKLNLVNEQNPDWLDLYETIV